MGDYTRLTIDVRLQAMIPPDVHKVLTYLTTKDEQTREWAMFDWGQKAPPIDHPFFKCERWESVFANSCAYLPVVGGTFEREWDYYRLKGSGCTKAYDGEYVRFLDWLRPYMIEEAKAQVIAYTEFDSRKYPRIEYTLTSDKQLTTDTTPDPAFKDIGSWN